MPKSKEIVSSSESGSGSEDEPKQKKQKVEVKSKSKASTSDSKGSKSASKKGVRTEDGEVRFDLGKNRFATACEFRGKKMVNIREFYQGDDGELKPGKKGIALTLEQWEKLKEQTSDIDEALCAL